jgi:thioredoxin-like negative regulator of GroEL
MIIHYFGATWCGPCMKHAKPYVLSQIETLKAQNHEVNFWDVSDDDHEDFVSRYNVKAVPVVVFEVDGVEVGRMEGWSPEGGPLTFDDIVATNSSTS